MEGLIMLAIIFFLLIFSKWIIVFIIALIRTFFELLISGLDRLFTRK